MPAQPKQFHNICNRQDDISLITQTYKRACRTCTPQNVFFVTNARQAPLIHQCISGSQIIVEPEARDSAPAIALGLKKCGALPTDIVIIMPSDHLMDTDAFSGVTNSSAFQSTCENGNIVLLGIRPTWPSTSFGYIETEIESAHSGVYKVSQFHEKPDEATALKYLQTGQFFWNCGIFCAQKQTFISELDKHAPNLLQSGSKISFDFAVMEKTTLAVVIPFESSWNDVGTWEETAKILHNDSNTSLTTFCPQDAQHTVEHIDSQNCFIYVASKHQKVVLSGVNDLNVIVDQYGNALISDKGNQAAENLKQIAKKLNENNPAVRPWGDYQVVDSAATHQCKVIHVLPQQRLSLQKHAKRAEHWIVVAGKAEVTVNETTKVLEAGDYVFIPIGAWHRVRNISDSDMLTFIEVQTGSYFGEDDIVRKEDDYGRQ